MSTLSPVRTVHPALPEGRGPWPGMGAVVAAAVAAMTPVFGVAALATPIERDAGISGTTFGLALSVFFAVTAAGSGVGRRVAARLPLPAVLLLIDLLAAAALLLAALADGPVWLIGALVVGGVANTLPQPAAGRYIAARVPGHRLSLATGLVGAALGAAPLLPGLLAGLVAVPYGPRTALVAAAAFPVLALAAVPLGRIGPARPRTPSTTVTGDDRAAGDAVRRRTIFRVLLLWTLAAGLATVGSNAAASYFIQIGTASGLSTAVAGLMQSLAGIVAIAVRLTAGGLADRAPRHNPVVVTVMMLSGALGLALTAFGTPVTFVIGAILAVAGGWGWTGLLLASVMRLLDGQGARAGAWMQAGLFTGAAVTPFTFGVVTGAIGVPGAVLLAAATALAGTLTMAAGILLRSRTRVTASRRRAPACRW
ncbi:MFS transporter [Actinoallomurus soli]|uniref:MFS transporter n=1 Tax=Actinoallomurus soli TaxID=2952535 RepID=UPI0020932911|nr:MFS transporter [Actinoallomurus soli]MCO5967611.1 MFS transporter [Actinoallomurus soli]